MNGTHGWPSHIPLYPNTAPKTGRIRPSATAACLESRSFAIARAAAAGCLARGKISGGNLLILADGGGGNGSRSRAWKQNLQVALCDRFGIAATVCHYPPGCSKWNPIEHRLFSQISRNWSGRPLRTLEIMLGYIRGTATTTGLAVVAHLDEATYKRGQKVSKEDLGKVKLETHAVCPNWNYTISPMQSGKVLTSPDRTS